MSRTSGSLGAEPPRPATAPSPSSITRLRPQRSWIERVPRVDKLRLPLPDDYLIGRRFAESLNSLDAGQFDKAMKRVVDPNDTGLPGIAALKTIVGAVMTVGLIRSVLALIISAIIWGFEANSSNPHLASRGKLGVLMSCAAAILCGAAITLINFFWNVDGKL